MNRIVFIVIISFFIAFLSCNSYKSSIKNEKNTNWEIKAIKFMGTITTQPYSVGEKSFWAFQDEHVVLKIRNNDFIENVKALKDNELHNFNEYNYAFIVRNEKQIDTFYSDYTLKNWILKKDNVESFFYDKDGKIAENLRFLYSFFSDCW
ncbi:MAG: hypothetical protein WDZ45_14245 [Flavobacteriaceae bacterium]